MNTHEKQSPPAPAPKTSPDATLPANVTADELLLIGAILEQPRRFYEVATIVSSNDFFSTYAKVFFAGLESADAESLLLSAIEASEEKYRDAPRQTDNERTAASIARVLTVPRVLGNHLAKAKRLGTMSASQFTAWCGAIVDQTPACLNIVEIAHLIADTSRVRQLEDLCREIINTSRLENQHPEAILGDAAQRVSALCLRHQESISSANFSEIVPRRFEQLVRDVEDRKTGVVRTVPTGFRAIDDATCGGMRNGQLWVIAARPGAGKTALSLNMATNIACAGHGVLFYSFEMGEAEIYDRLISAESSVPLSHFRQATIEDAHWPKITDVGMLFERTPLRVDWQAGKPLRRLISQASRDARSWGSRFPGTRLRVIFVDYLQLVTADTLPRNAARHEHVAEVARGLKILAKDLGVCVVALAQMSRDAEKTQRTPRLSDLAESAQIEAAADLVAFLTSSESGACRSVDVHIAKQRDGSPTRFALNYNGPITRFTDPDFPSGPSR